MKIEGIDFGSDFSVSFWMRSEVSYDDRWGDEAYLLSGGGNNNNVQNLSIKNSKAMLISKGHRVWGPEINDGEWHQLVVCVSGEEREASFVCGWGICGV